jgi:hypothetical protein
MEIKEQHELSIGNNLLRALGLNAQFTGHGSDGVEPDLIYLHGGRKIGIEIATAYYDEDQAKKEWQSARGALKPDPSGIMKIKGPGDWTGEPRQLIAVSVQQELNDKCSKKYSGVDEAWLCLEQHAPLADVSETQLLVSRLKVPSGHDFKRIYLVAHAHDGDGGGFRVYDLCPPLHDSI